MAKPLYRNDLVDLFVKAVQAEPYNWDNLEATTWPFGLLAGAAVALIECMELFAANPTLLPQWVPPQLYIELTDINIHGAINWECTPHFIMWAVGFHLNKALANLASAIELCTNQWLTMKRGDTGTTTNTTTFPRGKFKPNLEKLRVLLEQSNVGTEIKEKITALD